MKKALADALEDRGYTDLTPVQIEVTRPDLSGLDLLVSAQTGSGKTLGFGLAIAPKLFGEGEDLPPPGKPLALVIAPTRELAMQVKRELAWLYAKAGAVMASCVGGMDMRDERRSLGQGAHIVVATPGRLRDHIMRKSIDLGELRAVVLDEADEMLDLGFREDLEFILGESPDSRQTLMFSATVPASIATLAKKYQKDAVRITTKSESAQHADIEYRAMAVADRDVDNAIINTLRFYEAPNAIVFCNTRAMVSRLTTRLSNRGFSVVALSGELSQTERTHALQAMRDGRARVCVATDVAARGIDLPNLDLVVHAELPTNHETLLHRSGRTGRAGRKGVSTLIVPPKAVKKAERILSAGRLRATWSDAPSADMVRERDEDRMLNDAGWFEPITEGEQDGVEKLVARFAPEQIAAAYLRLHHAKHSAPEELSDPGEKPKPRAEFGPSVWFSVSGGRAQAAEPRRLLPMLCKMGGLTKDDIGAIRIQQDESYVQILERSVGKFLAAIGPEMRLEGGSVLARLNKPPVGYEDQDRATRPAPRPYEGQAAKLPRPAKVWDEPVASPAAKPRPTKVWDEPVAAPVAKTAPAPVAAPEPVKAPRAQLKAPISPFNPAAPRPPKDDAPDAPVIYKRKLVPAAPRAAGERPASEPQAFKNKDKPAYKPKGPPPPLGKPNSKKNKARATGDTRAGRKAARLTGGSAPPKRP